MENHRSSFQKKSYCVSVVSLGKKSLLDPNESVLSLGCCWHQFPVRKKYQSTSTTGGVEGPTNQKRLELPEVKSSTSISFELLPWPRNSFPYLCAWSIVIGLHPVPKRWAFCVFLCRLYGSCRCFILKDGISEKETNSIDMPKGARRALRCCLDVRC